MRGDMHLLREMVRTKNFHPVDQATLPFQPPPDGQWDVDPLQTKRCSMANLFNLVRFGRANFKEFLDHERADDEAGARELLVRCPGVPVTGNNGVRT